MKRTETIDGHQDQNTMKSNDIPELFQALRQTPVELQNLISGLSPGQMRVRRSNDEFSVVENLCHLRDIEIEGYKVRIHRILTEDEPHLADLDGSRLAVERNYNAQSATQALSDFHHARSENLQILDRIQKTEFLREGRLEGVGKITLEELVSLMQQHDEDHLSDLKILCRWVATKDLMSTGY